MKKKTLILIYAILHYTNSFAQTYTLYGDKAFGSDSHDHVPSVVNLSNGNFLLACYSFGTISGDKTVPSCDTTFNPDADIWLLKIDTSFNILWNKCYGGLRDEYHPYIIKTKNADRFILTSASFSDSSCQKTSDNKDSLNYTDYWTIAIDSNGNPLNDHTWGATLVERYPQTIELNSGNFIICGTSTSPISGDKTVANYADSTGTVREDYWIIKTDSAGNKIWDKVFGGTGKEYDNIATYENMFNILPDKNDAFILAGTTDSPLSGDISDSSRGMKDIWIIKIDSAGNKLWDKRYGGSGNEQCNYIMHTADNGYLAGGSTFSPQGGDVSDSSKGDADCWILKLDSAGNKQWDKRYGGNKNDDATWIERAPGGGYWISGVSYSDSSGDVSEPRYAFNAQDYWIFKIDDMGNKLWDRRFGGPGANRGSTFTIMPDGSIFLFGSSISGTSAVKTDSGRGSNDIWIVHFKYTCATASNINAVVCNSYTSPGGNYTWTVSGIYLDTIPNYMGCDSVITVNLTINNTTSSAQNITACYSYTSPSGNYNWTSSGIYTDTIPNANGCDSVITMNLTINNADTSVTQIINTLTANASGATYQWLDCDSGYAAINGATSQSFTPLVDGNYAVAVTQNGCTDTSSCYTILGTGINENSYANGFTIIPNPSTGQITITSSKIIDEVTITNPLGQVVYEAKPSNKNLSLQIKDDGIYFVTITSDKKTTTGKVIVQH